jgi:hypothetical protein
LEREGEAITPSKRGGKVKKVGKIGGFSNFGERSNGCAFKGA